MSESRAQSGSAPEQQEEQSQEVAGNGQEASHPESGDGQVAQSLEAELAAARAEAAENYDRYLRAMAELDNYRKRTARVRQEAREELLREVLLQLAPILDNLRRALAQETTNAGALKQGVELTQNQFQDLLNGYGLRPIEAVGQSFDPKVHEALMEMPSDEHPPGTVLEEVEKGYELNDRVVRPARVIVSKSS